MQSPRPSRTEADARRTLICTFPSALAEAFGGASVSLQALHGSFPGAWPIRKQVCVFSIPPRPPKHTKLRTSYFFCVHLLPLSTVSSQVYEQTTIRKPIECAPEASSGGREWAEMTEGFRLEATRHSLHDLT